MKLLRVSRSPKKDKKLVAVFETASGGKKTVHFGAKSYGDYTIYRRKDKELAEQKRKQYIARHRSSENWRSPTTPGALSRYILWEKPTVKSAVAAYKKRFGI